MLQFLKTFKRVSFVAFLLIFFFALSSIVAPRAAQAAQTCQLQGSLDALKDAHEKFRRDSAEGLRAQLSARKDLLTRVLDCSLSEVEELKTNLAQLNIKDKEGNQVQSQLISSLSQAIEYYQNKKDTVPDLGMRGSQELARALKEWRGATYAPLAQEITNFILWNRNQELIQTALSRKGQVEHTLRGLRLEDNNETEDMLEKAIEHLNEATTANDEAKRTLRKRGSIENTLDQIKLSLEHLSKTYQIFFDISEKVNSLLSR